MTNAIAELEQRATRQRAEEEAAEAYSVAMTRLLRGKINDSGRRDMPSCAFFATLAMRLKRKADWSVDTACVDGKSLRYNPEFWLGMSADERVAVLAHEVLHCSNAHHVRRGSRDAYDWNVACDLAINPLLRDAGFILPRDVLYPGMYELSDGLSAEEYYTALPPDPAGGNRDSDDPGQCGGVVEPDAKPQKDGDFPVPCDAATARQQETEWEIATAQAAQAAKQRGELSSGLQRFVEAVTAPKVDWKAELREFVNSHAKNDYAWIPPNRRFVHMGLYLPSLNSEELGDVVVACDCSGSIGKRELTTFASEIMGIASVAQCSVTVLYHHTEVSHIQRWEPTDGPLKLEPGESGGTDHRPVFEWIDRHEPPTCAIFLTDLWSAFPDSPPAYPVLWGTEGELTGPFGRTIRIGAAP